MRVLLVSTYELGHQPIHLAAPAAALIAQGHDVRCTDLSVDELDLHDVQWAEKVAFSVPMHTAMRIAQSNAQRIRLLRPELPFCFYGLYAQAGAQAGAGVEMRPATDSVISGEYEEALLAWVAGKGASTSVELGRRNSASAPARYLLAPLDRFARLAITGEERLVGSVEASRGCSHRCRHCPVPVVYDGRVRPVDEDFVLADIDQLVALGAQHINFADPDFLNMPQHSLRLIRAMHQRHPHLTFDCTTKVEHILRHRDLWEEFAGSGCIFVVSAFETVNDTILEYLDKGHIATDASAAVIALREHRIEVRPSWMPFTPWTDISDLTEILDFVIDHDLVTNVDPVQYTLRLLLPQGSLLLDQSSMAPYLRDYDSERLSWTWTHPDPRIDELQVALVKLVEARIGDEPESTFAELEGLIRGEARSSLSSRPSSPRLRGSVSVGPTSQRPRLTESWFCCSEPTEAQLSPSARLIQIH